MRAVYTVGLKVHSPGSANRHGNTVDTWADPVDFPVYWIAPSGSQEPGADRTAVVTGYSIGAPAGAVVSPYDRFVIDGDEWEVDGEIADYSRGPFGFEAGVVVTLKRAEG